MAISDNLTVTSVQARKAILKAFKAKRPVFLWGPPGIGKSEVVADITNELGGFMIDLRMAQMEPLTCVVSPTSTKITARWTGLRPLICPIVNLLASTQLSYCF